MKKFAWLICLSLLVWSCQQSGKNWNQYLGPDRNATITDAGIAKTWPEDGPKKVWEISLGSGYGGASTYGDEVFLLDREVGKKDILRCLDLNTGNEKWRFEYEAEGEIPYPGSRAVPTVSDKYVWSVGPHGHLYCVDKKTHQGIWSVNLLEKYGGELDRWGFSISPVIYEDLVIVSPQGSSGLAAFNKLTGETVWETRSFPGRRFHVSPTLASYAGVDQVIMVSSTNKGDGNSTDEVVSFEAASGKELWKYEGLNSFASIAPVTIVDESRLLLSECAYNDKYDPVTVMLEISKEGEKFQFKELFFNTEAGSKMHPPVILGDYFYLNNTARPNLQMTCMSLDGKVMWEKGESPNFELGGLILIDGLIINQNGKNGDIHLIQPTPDGYKELGKASFFNSKKSQAWAPLAFADGKLLVRDMEKLVCVDLVNVE